MRNKNIDPYCLERGYSYNDNNNDNNNYNNYYNGSNVTEMIFMCPGAGKKKYVSENMQDQIPIAYAIWKILIILVMTILCIVCIRQINAYVNMQKLKKKNICTANLFKQLFLLVAAITRWLWLLDPHYNSRIWPAPLFGTKQKTYAAVTLVLITLPQIIYLIVLNLEIRTLIYLSIYITTTSFFSNSNNIYILFIYRTMEECDS